MKNFRGKYCMCQLEFYTNKNKKYGPYGSASSSGGCYEGKRSTIIFLSIFLKVLKAFYQIFVYILWIVKNVPCDWSEAIKMDCFPVGFAGASVSFLFIFFEQNFVVKFNYLSLNKFSSHALSQLIVWRNFRFIPAGLLTL